jgi:SAM-dependent methyltransferase
VTGAEAPAELARRARERALAHGEILDVLAERAPGPRLLDVGCSLGMFLEAARERGFSVEGVELSLNAVRHATALLGLPVRHGTVLEAGLPAGTYDAVTMLNVLAHLAEPGPTLCDTFRLLRPGGVLALEVPNATFNLLRGRLRPSALSPGHHLFYFTAPALRRMLVGVGFASVEVWCGRGGRPGGRLFNTVKAAWVLGARMMERAVGWRLGPALVALATKGGRAERAR